MAVPALRVLEDRGSSNIEKIKKNIKPGLPKEWTLESSTRKTDVDVIGERGFVGDVKALPVGLVFGPTLIRERETQ